MAATGAALASFAFGTASASALTASGPAAAGHGVTVTAPYRHGILPMLGFHVSGNSATPAASSNDLNYGGGIDGIGVTTGKEKVYLVFYGSQWGTASTNSSGDTTLSGDPDGAAPYLQEFFKGLGTGNETWSGVMTQYCDGVATGAQSCPASNTSHVAYPTGGALAGVWEDTSTSSPSSATGHQLGQEAVSAAAHFGNTTAAANRDAQYVILSPTGTNPDGWLTNGFCAWHDYNGDSTLSGGPVTSPYGDIAFTNLPYVDDQGSSCGQGFVNSPGTNDGFSIVEGHEYAETITDQNPAGGWTDSSGSETGDKCAWISSGQGASQDISLSTGSFAVQSTWANDFNSGAGGCEVSHAIVTNPGGGGGNTVTVSSPGNQSGTVGTAVSLQISATDSASGQTLTYTASGLPAGLSISSSGLISGTPTTAGTSSVTVTAKDTTGASGTASFTWTIGSSGGGGCTSPGNVVKNGTFASGSTSWTASSGVIGQWGSSGEPAYTGTYDAWLDGYGASHTDTLSQSVTIPSGCSATLHVWLHIDSAQTSGTNGSFTIKVGSTTVGTFTNLNAASGYTEHSYNVSSAAGTTVKILFTGVETNSNNTSYVVGEVSLVTS
jgi:Putative Ig domain